MVGDGGNGNPYSCSGRQSPYDSGENGGTGENCGKVNINNNIHVIAYGGKGGNGGVSGNSAGGGGGGYPAAGIGRRSELGRWRC